VTYPPLPRRRFYVDRWVTISQVSADEMRAVVGAQGKPAVAAWVADVATIYILRGMSLARRWRALGHEEQHALTDLMDQTP
jgi:hypothetical protein